jgi:hypothetical protein
VPTAQNAPVPPPAPMSLPGARYTVRFDATWSQSSHPIDWPDDAHFSGLIGGTHNDLVTFWAEGRLASTGIRDMAERGRKSPLDQEVMDAIARGTAQFVLSGDALGRSPGSVSMTFDITAAFPRVTLVTMVAPSPDWFVGVSGLSLVENDAWVVERRVEVFAYDAGTDSGRTYRAPDQVTVPFQPISLLTVAPIAGPGPLLPIGTFTFRKEP